MRRWAMGLAGVMMLAGCGHKAATGGETPDATFAQFDQAMQAGEYDQAAALIDYDYLAQQANPDWDSIPPGQQREITGKMAEDAAGRLKAMGYPSGGMTSPGMVANGDSAMLKASGGGQALSLGMTKTEAGWRIISGLPTMTTQ